MASALAWLISLPLKRWEDRIVLIYAILIVFLAAVNCRPASAQEGCDLIGLRPEFIRNSDSDMRIVGVGTRECSGTPRDARIEILLRNDRRFWFDQTLAQGEFTATGSLTTRQVIYRCSRGDYKNAYVELRNRSFDGKRQSPRASISCF
jgi:hypothetical protein